MAMTGRRRSRLRASDLIETARIKRELRMLDEMICGDDMEETEMKLEKCPFCGGEAYFAEPLSIWVPDDWRQVACDDCGARGSTCESKVEAAEMWNKRLNTQVNKKEQMYRRQLGGAEAALRRERQHVAELHDLVASLMAESRRYKDEADALKELLRAVLRCAEDTVWVGECETLADAMADMGIEVGE